MNELFEKLNAQLKKVRVKTQAMNNFFSVAVTKANKFQTKISLKRVLESTNIVYI